MANIDIELELWALRVNVSGIRQDVREVKIRVLTRERSTGPQFPDAAEQHARYERLQGLIERIDERLAALELRCSSRSPRDASR